LERGKIVRQVLILFCLFTALSWGQSYTGSIRGTVTDHTKAAVPGAKVTVTDADRNVEFSTLTDSSGRYILPTLPAARYALTVEAQGFDKAAQPAFALEVQQQATVDVELKIGSLATTVEVQGAAPLLNTVSATLGQVVENRMMMTIPQNTRNPLGLILLAPGIVSTGSGTNFVSSGVRNNASEVLMDGGPLTGIEQNGGVTDVKYTPTVDVVEEFKVQTNFFSAEFGNSGGTVINMVSKSGTNQVHGVGYYFRRDNALNANNWFSNARNSPLADSKRDNYGATIGGPVAIPKIYNGRNRTFFFFDYDRISALSATTSLGSVPTAQQLSGDFSDTRLANGNLVPLYDPYNTFKDASGNTLRNPIPGNVIPLSRQNPITLNFIKYYPAPNLPGNQFTRNNNWFGQGSTPSDGNKIDVKIDQNFSDKQRLSARYGVNWTSNGVANLVNNISFNGNPGTERDQNFIMDYTRTQSPTTVIALRAGILRVKSIRDPLSTGFDATTLGLPAYMTSGTGTKAFPQFSAQYRSMGAGGYAIIHRYEDVYQYMGSVTKIVNGHTVKAGAELRKLHENYYQPNTPNGSFSFSRNTTALNPTVSSSTQGDGLASALLGWGSGGQVSIDFPTAQSSGYFGTYVNDDWRVSRRLTVNLGLRYDFDIPRTDRFNRINWMDLSAPSPIADVPSLKAIFPNGLMGVMRFADNNHRTPYDGDYNNVQPRVGFAYALNNKTSLRGAYGLFYVVSRHTIKGEVGTAFGFTDSSIPWSLDSGLTQYATFGNPWPAGLTYPPGRNPSFFLGMGAGTPLPKDDNPQYQQWTFSIQREVPGQGVVEINYVGTKGTHLYFGTGDVVSNLDTLNPIYWGLGRGTSGTGLNAQVANPFYGIITNPVATTYNQPTIQLRRLLTPYPEYTSIGGYRASRNIGNSIYHALQLKYEKRFSRGLSMVAHYTFSKMISDSDESGSDVDFFAGGSSVQDIFNLRNERSLSTFDRTHRLVVSFDYQLPVGRQRMFGKSMNRILDGVIGGWELSSIITANSGAPLGITQSASNLWNSANQRPNVVGDPRLPGSTRDKLNQYFNVNAFQQVNPDIIGSSPRFLSNYRGPVLVNEDAALMKNFNIRERKYVQLRLEAYSLKNSPQWGMPNTSFGDTSFGQITTSTGFRTLQVAAKFYY
jgi:hypothetical protein